MIVVSHPRSPTLSTGRPRRAGFIRSSCRARRRSSARSGLTCRRSSTLFASRAWPAPARRSRRAARRGPRARGRGSDGQPAPRMLPGCRETALPHWNDLLPWLDAARLRRDLRASLAIAPDEHHRYSNLGIRSARATGGGGGRRGIRRLVRREVLQARRNGRDGGRPLLPGR